MNKTIIAFCVAAAFVVAAPATAAPGVGSKVYGATVEAGFTEFEARYGRLTGDAADGEDGLVLEIAHGFSPRFYGALLAEFEREPGDGRRLEAVAAEAIVTLGRIDALGLDTAIYGEFEIGINGPEKGETKLLLQHKRGPFDSRLNLIAERDFVHGAPLEFGYAASADYEIADEFRLGVQAYGDLGSTRGVTTRAAHFAGPVAKYEIEHLLPGELAVEAGYLFAIGRARDETNGQIRLALEYEFKL